METLYTVVMFDLLIIDGFEGHLARVELPGGQTIDLPRDWLPAHIREGDCLRVQVGEAQVLFQIDPRHQADHETAQRELDALNAVSSSSEISL